MTGFRELKTLMPFIMEALAYFVSRPPTSTFSVVKSLKKNSDISENVQLLMQDAKMGNKNCTVEQIKRHKKAINT